MLQQKTTHRFPSFIVLVNYFDPSHHTADDDDEPPPLLRMLIPFFSKRASRASIPLKSWMPLTSSKRSEATTEDASVSTVTGLRGYSGRSAGTQFCLHRQVAQAATVRVLGAENSQESVRAPQAEAPVDERHSHGVERSERPCGCKHP